MRKKNRNLSINYHIYHNFLQISFESSAIVLKKKNSFEKAENPEENSHKSPPKLERPENDKKRDRVMFGFMMNHLKKAKTVLEHDTSLVKNFFFHQNFTKRFFKSSKSSKNKKKCLKR